MARDTWSNGLSVEVAELAVRFELLCHNSRRVANSEVALRLVAERLVTVSLLTAGGQS